MPQLVTIEAVPIVRVGTYDLASGTRTFTEEDLRAAADAWATDAAVKNPRIKIDSLAKAMGLDDDAHGGEPAFGYFDNLRVSENGQELLADAHVPESIRDGMEWAYPSLSIEGTPPGWTSATGRSHELVITAVALLGVHWPGVTTLEDLTAFLSNGPTIEKTDAPEEVLATMPQRARPVAASLDSDLVGRRFYDLLDSGDLETPEGVSAYDLWIRSMRFDDDGRPYLKVTDESSGTLYRVDLTVSGSEVTFGEFVEVVEQDVPVTASTPRPAEPLRTWASREQSRAVRATQPSQEEGTSMTDEQRQTLAQRHGLDPATATEAEVLEAVMNAAPAGQPESEPEGEPQNHPENEPEPVAARAQLPEGVVVIDADELARLRAGAQTATELAAAEQTRQRDRTIEAAIGEGRIPPARREHYAAMWNRDPDGTRHLLTASEAEGGLAPNTIPLTARGVAPTDEATAATADAEHEAFMRRHYPQAMNRSGGRVRTRTEV